MKEFICLQLFFSLFLTLKVKVNTEYIPEYLDPLLSLFPRPVLALSSSSSFPHTIRKEERVFSILSLDAPELGKRKGPGRTDGRQLKRRFYR